MTDIENMAHILGQLAKDHEKVMQKGRAHYIVEQNAQRYVRYKVIQEQQIKELQEGTPQCQI